MPTAQELGEILQDSEIYRCKSETCGDNGGVCVLIIPCIFDKPQNGKDGCCYADNFEGDEDGNGDCDCEWELI